jgi:hypothetical protein
MRKALTLILVLALPSGFASRFPGQDPDPLAQPVGGFDLQNQTVIDGLGMIRATRQPALSVEFPLKKDLNDPPLDDHLISAHINAGSLRNVLDQLIALDTQYTWSAYKRTINVYPRSLAAAGKNYLLNRKIANFDFTRASDPSELILKTVSLLPGHREQIAFLGTGPFDQFDKPWTARFTNLSIREILDELAEHLCSDCGWTLGGASNFRVIQFHEHLLPVDPRPVKPPSKNAQRNPQ